jgi:hypothetical protein
LKASADVAAPKLYIDEDAAETAVIVALRRIGIDVSTVIEEGLSAASDIEQLRFASAASRVLYSLNVGDFAQLHNEFRSRAETHFGIVLIPRQRYNIGEKVRRLSDLLSTTDADAMRNTIYFL